MKKKNKYEIKSDDHKEAMLKLGKLQKVKNDLIYKSSLFYTFVSFLTIALVVALSIVFYKYFVVDFIANRATQIVVAVVFSFVVFFLASFVLARPLGKIHDKVCIKKAYKNHAEELTSLDNKIDALVNEIIKLYGGEKDVILKESDTMYRVYAEKQNREFAKDRIRDNSYFSSSSSYSDSTYDSDTSSDNSSSSSDSSSGYDSSSSRQTFTDDLGREVAYRDGDRVYSSDTHDLVGYMSGNQLYSYDDGRIGEFDDDGNFTKYK